MKNRRKEYLKTQTEKLQRNRTISGNLRNTNTSINTTTDLQFNATKNNRKQQRMQDVVLKMMKHMKNKRNEYFSPQAKTEKN